MRVERPETRYAWNGDVSLAYQIVGDGPTDLVYLQGYCSQIDLNWESPYLARFLRGLARSARLIVTDRRGWGCSERFTPGYVPDVDVLTDDVLAVLRAAESERAAIVATYESAIVGSLFAAVYPERVRALVLIDPQLTYLPTVETPWMPNMERWQEQIRLVRETWGTLEWWDAPTGPEREWFARYARASVTPGGLAAELSSYLETDICAVLPSLQVPALVFVDTDAFYEVPPATGHLAASRIPGARVVEGSSEGGTTSTGMPVARPSWRRSTSSWQRSATRRSHSIASSRPFCSLTSSGPQRRRPASATEAGARSWKDTMRLFERCSRATGAARWILRATGCSPLSTGRRARSAARSPSPRPFAARARSASRCPYR